MPDIHDYDKNRWQGELTILEQVSELLESTEVSNTVRDEISASVTELKGFLKYGCNEEGTGPDYPVA